MPDCDVTVFTYRPPDCGLSDIALVFHGMSRNAADYRDHARPRAEARCFFTVAPRFDAERFSLWRYDGGGVADEAGLRPAAEWTVFHVGPPLAWSRKAAGDEDALLPVVLFGHSGGAQFTACVAAFGAVGPNVRVVLSNASTYVFPTMDAPVPFGFGGLPPAEAKVLIRAYIGRTVILYLGVADTGTENLYQGSEGVEQGANRLACGRALFDAVREAVAKHSLVFPWVLVEAPGVGHSARRILSAPEAEEAFGIPGTGTR